MTIYERISLGVDSDLHISATLRQIGCCLIEMNQLTEALDYLQQSLAVYEQKSLVVDSDPRIFTTSHYISNSLIKMHQLTEALDYVLKTIIENL